MLIKMWGDKHYHTWNYHLREEFGHKVLKLPIDAGFSCPNRDGTISKIGCIYCSEEGSGDFTPSSKLSIEEQYLKSKDMMSKKWPNGKYIIYFQAFSNTYAPIEKLKKIYYQALELEDVVGVAIATRPDCLSTETIQLLSEINKITYLWVELGLQTIHDHTARLINRGHSFQSFLGSLDLLQAANIRTCAHVIYGLPHESKEEMLETSHTLAKLPLQGIKLHSLYIQKNTILANYYDKQKFPLLTLEEYVDIVVDTIELLPENFIIHRLTGDAPRDQLIAPSWSLKKWEVLNAIDKEFKRRNTKQGYYKSK